MCNCEKCGLDFKNNTSLSNHQKGCRLNKKDIENIKLDYIENKNSIHFIEKKYNICFGIIKKILKDNIRNEEESRKYKNYNKILSEETKQKISDGRKKYLRENPDKHPWKKNSKFISIPCESFKNILRNNNIKFVEEYSDFKDHNYSVDIAFPEYKIGIEVNGNQHYNKDGSLSKYYQKRHNYLVSCGWSIFELHYLVSFNESKILEIVDNVLNEQPIFDFNYDEYLLKVLNKGKYICHKCGNGKVTKKSEYCISCLGIVRRKTERPTLDVLLKDINELGYSKTGRKYGVSDNAIRKWIK